VDLKASGVLLTGSSPLSFVGVALRGAPPYITRSIPCRTPL
jgi:hypothetical protein